MKLIKSKKKYKLIDQTVSDIYLKLDINKRSIIISNQHLIDTIYLNQIMSKINKIALKLLPLLDDEDSDYDELVLVYDELARLRDYILNNYDKYLSKSAKMAYLKNIRFLNLELKKKIRNYSFENQIKEGRRR